MLSSVTIFTYAAIKTSKRQFYAVTSSELPSTERPNAFPHPHNEKIAPKPGIGFLKGKSHPFPKIIRFLNPQPNTDFMPWHLHN